MLFVLLVALVVPDTTYFIVSLFITIVIFRVLTALFTYGFDAFDPLKLLYSLIWYRIELVFISELAIRFFVVVDFQIEITICHYFHVWLIQALQSRWGV
jgi:hypothetical protein